MGVSLLPHSFDFLCWHPGGDGRAVGDRDSGLGFRSRVRAILPGSASSRKNPEKIGKNGAENGGKWRFSEGQSAISPGWEPTALDRKPPSCQTLRLWSPVASSRQRPANSQASAIFHTPGTNRQGCDRRDLTIVRIGLRGIGKPATLGPRAPTRRRVARETRAVCSSDAARWRSGRHKGHRPRADRRLNGLGTRARKKRQR